MMSISYYGEQILSHSYDLKKIGAISRYPYFFQPYLYGFRENYYVGVSLLIVFYILSITMKSNADENYG
jgi:hypothetical protein